MSENKQEGSGGEQESHAAPTLAEKAGDEAVTSTSAPAGPGPGAAVKDGSKNSPEPTVSDPQPAVMPPSPPPPPSSTTGGKGGRFVQWLLLLLLVLAVGYLGWQHWLQANSDLGDHRDALSRLNQNLNQLDDDLGNVRQTLERQLVAVEQRAETREEHLRNRLRDTEGRLNEITQTDRADAILTEVDHLLRLASQRLLADQDIRVTLGLYESADQLLRDLDDPELLGLREAVVSDLTALRLVERVDRSGLYLRLDALQKIVASLPLERHEHGLGERVDTQASSNDQSEVAGWQRPVNALRKAWGHLDNYIRIYRRDQPLQPLLSPDEEVYLRLNLRLMLEQAQLAVLQQEPDVYTSSLSKAQGWLQDYFVNDDRSQALQDELAALLQLEVTQATPDLSTSLGTLRQIMRARVQLSAGRESQR